MNDNFTLTRFNVIEMTEYWFRALRNVILKMHVLYSILRNLYFLGMPVCKANLETEHAQQECSAADGRRRFL